VDVLLTRWAIAGDMVERGGDSIMLAKGNQARPAPRHPPGLLRGPRLGRDEGNHRDGLGLAPVCHLERHVTSTTTGEPHHAVGYGVSSRGPDRADPERVRAGVRGPWQIATKVHGVCEVTCDADRSPVRGGRPPRYGAAMVSWSPDRHHPRP
jgi:hypothetical protein